MASKKPRRRMSDLAVIISIVFAVFFDVVSIFIPFVGVIFVWTLRLIIYPIEGFSGGLISNIVKGKGGKIVFLKIIREIGFWGETIGPLPGCITYVITVVLLNRTGYKARMIEEALEQKLQLTAQMDHIKRLQRYYGGV